MCFRQARCSESVCRHAEMNNITREDVMKLRSQTQSTGAESVEYHYES